MDDIDTSTLNTVVDGHVGTGVVVIDFSTLDVEIDTVKIPAGVVKQVAAAVNGQTTTQKVLRLS